MKHELRKEKVIGCDPVRYEAKCAVVDSFTRRAFDDDDDEDLDGETDIYGDPIPKMEMRGAVAVIPIKGVIACDIPRLFKAFGFVDLRDVAANIQAALLNPECAAIALDFDSPGGTLRGVSETADLVASVQTGDKPIESYASGDCCSAAYYIAAGSGRIVAAPSSEMGSIGVYSARVNATKAYELMGYRVEIFKSGKYKAAGAYGTDLTDEQKSQIQDRIDGIGAEFRAHVSAYRTHIKPDAMEGQSFSGTDAGKNGIADDVMPSLAAFLDSIDAKL